MKIRAQERRVRAEKLLAERAERTDKQQIARLDKMFGVRKGAKRERARLLAREVQRAVSKDHSGQDKR
jgi:hypothetical protein